MLVPYSDYAIPHFYNKLLWYSFPALDNYSKYISHGFSSRIGGVSEGYLATLNLSPGRGNFSERVRENYRRFGEATGFDPNQAVFSYQSHGTNIREAISEDAGKGLTKKRDYHNVDGLMTKEKGLPLVTHYADCTPLLFYAPDQNIVAISHAGWRGTICNMASKTIEKFVSFNCDPNQLIAVIGPSAGPEKYEVEEDCALKFAKIVDETGPVVRQISKKGKFLLDLWRANRAIMISGGMNSTNISIAGLCTITFCDIFYSYRVQGKKRGTLAGFIMLK